MPIPNQDIIRHTSILFESQTHHCQQARAPKYTKAFERIEQYNLLVPFVYPPGPLPCRLGQGEQHEQEDKGGCDGNDSLGRPPRMPVCERASDHRCHSRTKLACREEETKGHSSVGTGEDIRDDCRADNFTRSTESLKASSNEEGRSRGSRRC
jgi:hypothetical protein